ncbi:MAG TPA: hypothetical protein P5277_04370 [Candidatus Paceibacterota bacterium]|nr:hypothetical protein [Candidatus Paceibacterota bacterium]
MTSLEEAKYWRDKFVLQEEGRLSKEGSVLFLQISPDNYDRIINEKKIPKKYLDILEDPNLFEKITVYEFDKKIVGEIESRKVIFLCANGRLVNNSQVASYNLLVNSESGAGKDYETSKVLEILPKEQYIKKTRISPMAFTYWHNSTFEPDWTWNGKVFYCEDISESILNSDVFKVMCSNGSSATIVIKQKAYEIEINGKPVIITTTATANPNPEAIRRNVLLQLDESVNQTKEIMKRHAEFKKRGIMPEYNQDLIEAQKFLERVNVKIPFADLLCSYFPEENIIMRTNFPRFLDFISASTALYQFQRKKDYDGFVLSEGRDYSIARECFLKLFSNKYMIPLTRNQRQILSFFNEIPTLKGSVSQLYNSHGINFISDRALETNLKTLVRYGILTSAIDKDVLNRDIVVYFLNKSYSLNETLNLPKFEEIIRNASESSVSSITSITSLSSITNSLVRDVEDIEVSEGLICIEEIKQKPKGEIKC